MSRRRLHMRDLRVVPPGGFSYSDGSVTVRGDTFADLDVKVRGLLDSNEDTRTVDEAVAEYISRSTPMYHTYVCDSPSDSVVVPSEAYRKSRSFHTTVSQEAAERRLASCLKCPMHRRSFCLSCTGYAKALSAITGYGMTDAFAKSGVCGATGAFEMAVVSSDGGSTDFPAVCWARTGEKR